MDLDDDNRDEGEEGGGDGDEGAGTGGDGNSSPASSHLNRPDNRVEAENVNSSSGCDSSADSHPNLSENFSVSSADSHPDLTENFSVRNPARRSEGCPASRSEGCPARIPNGFPISSPVDKATNKLQFPQNLRLEDDSSLNTVVSAQVGVITLDIQEDKTIHNCSRLRTGCEL